MRFDQFGITAFLESSPTGDIWKVIIIEEGLSKNGKFYSKEALQKAIPLFEKSKVCFYEWKGNTFDHIPLSIEKIRPEGFPLQTAGWLENVKYETVNIEGRSVSGLTGQLHLLENNSKVAELKQMLVDAWKKGLKNLLGLSINAEGPSRVRMLNGQPVTVVSGITKVYSTDFVTQPAAGGGLLKLVESLNQKGGIEQMFKKILEALRAWNPKLLESIDIENITEEEVIGIFESLVTEAKNKKSDKCKELEGIVKHLKDKKYDEAEKLLNEVIKIKEMTDEELMKCDDADLTPVQKAKKAALLKAKGDGETAKAEEARKKQEELDNKNKDLEAKMADINTKLKKRECKEMLELALSEANLPEPIKNKIRNSFKDKIFEEADLKESMKIEQETLAKLVESGATFDLGDDRSGAFVEREPVTRLQASLDLMLGHKPSDDEKDQYKDIDAFTSLREAYVAYTDDPGITGRLGPKAIARLQEATEANFSYALGFSMQRRMLPEYKKIDPLWKKIAITVPIKDFKLQERIKWGGFGVLPTVQAARTIAGTPIDSATPSYPELGFPTDQEATYAVMTKGGMITVTRRMIIDDDLKVLNGIPSKVGKAAGYTLNQFVFDLMLSYNTSGINQANIYDSAVLYVTAHKNNITGALGYDNLSTLLDAMYHQTEWGYKTDSTNNPLAAGGTTLSVTAATGQYFKAGDLVWMEGEILRVDSVSTDDLTVARGVFGTTAAQHASGTDVYKISQILALEKPILWVPRGLRGTALQLKISEFNPEGAERAINALRDAFDPQVSPYLRGDENNYYLSANPSDIEGIEVGFLNGREDPEILVQDQPTVGDVFVYDTIRYKVRHEYGGAVVDFRAFAGAIVA
jgi:hypothetical protein